MNRRDLIALLGSTVATWPVGARAQQPRMPVVGFLGGGSPDLDAKRVGAFRQGLSEAGYAEGKNVAFEYRWAEGRYDRFPALATDLVRRQVNVIAALGGTPSALAAKAATTSIPVIFETAVDPVEFGLVESLNRPGGNLTGVTILSVELGPKLLELAHELVPGATAMALLVNPTSPIAETLSRDTQAAARTLGLQLHVLQASTEREFDTVFATLVELQVGAVVIGPDVLFTNGSDKLAALMLRHALPAIYSVREFAAAGGPDKLRPQYCGDVASRGHLHRPDSQWREAGRFAGPASHEGRAGHQSQGSRGAGPYLPNHVARPCRRGN
jgi:putative tryptophan/tyrosine transport system substrate-binding protein